MDYEVVIPTAKKDYNKIPYVIKSVKEHLYPQPQTIHIIHAGDYSPDLSCDFPNISYHYERNVIDLDPNLAKGFNRPPWIYQQFIKLFQNVSSSKYLVVDSDLFFNKDVNLLTDEKIPRPKFFFGVDQNHKPYFKYSEDMFGFGREHDYSFISEIMLFDRDITNKLLEQFFIHRTGQHGNFYTPNQIGKRIYYDTSRDNLIKSLYHYTCDGACDSWIPADYEIYGNFVEKYFPNMYAKVHIKTNLKGKYSEWSNEELEQYIKEMSELNQHDFFTAHTWI